MSNKNTKIKLPDISELFYATATLIAEARKRVAVAVNAEVALLNYKVGVHIQTFILFGNRAPYGQQIIIRLADRLTIKFGSGWSDKHLRHCLRCAESFTEAQIVSAVQRQLTWTHLKTLIYVNDQLKRHFYLEMSALQNWNTRTLSNQIDKMLYERTAIATKPHEQIVSALKDLKEDQIINSELVFKNCYILDFMGLKGAYSERDLETALIANLQQFIMELGIATNVDCRETSFVH
jgi:predicted nuclease of restriction endonuclease-like (RecB) superfamily